MLAITVYFGQNDFTSRKLTIVITACFVALGSFRGKTCAIFPTKIRWWITTLACPDLCSSPTADGASIEL